MRICHVIDYFHTDVGYQEFFLAREQARAGHDVRVVTSTLRQHTVASAGPDEQRGLDELRGVGVDLVRLPALQLGHDRAWLRGLERAIRDHHPDTAHVHGPFSPTTVRAVWACHRLGAAVLVDNHIQDSIAPGSAQPLARAMYRAYRVAPGGMLRRHVGAWVANGPGEADFLEERLGIPPGRVELVPLGFDPEVYSFDSDRRARGRELEGWSEDETVVAVTGKLHPGKQVEKVVAAVDSAAATRVMRLVLAGSIDADYLARLRAAAPQLTATGRLEHRPLLPRDDLAALYLNVDVVVFARLPSISIYEAAGTGVRLLVGRDRFANWLHSLLPAIEAIDLAKLPEALHPADNRGARAEAARVLSWPVVSQLFLDRYEQLRCTS